MELLDDTLERTHKNPGTSVVIDYANTKLEPMPGTPSVEVTTEPVHTNGSSMVGPVGFEPTTPAM